MSHISGHSHSVARLWRLMLATVLLVGFLVGFRKELELTWKLNVAYFYVLFGLVSLPLNAETFRAVVLVVINVVIIGVGYLLMLFWVSHFVLPVSVASDKWKVYKRLFVYNLPFKGAHGPAIFVKDGKPNAGQEELDESDQGVALLDHNSAVVLEQQWGNDDIGAGDGTGTQLSSISIGPIRFLTVGLKKIFHFLESDSTNNNESIVRALGPGLALTEYGEKIAGWADLRKQFRVRTKVCCNTGDGIEVSTNVFALFTLGQRADVLHVVKVDGDWRIIKLDGIMANGDNENAHQKQIKILSDELGEAEKSEIENFFIRNQFVWAIGEFDNVTHIADTGFPFAFDDDRVIAAVYSRARDAKEGRFGDWTDLPVDVAVEIFRNMVAHKIYDDLYVSKDPDEYPLRGFKTTFSFAVRRTGVLAYQIVRRKDGRPLEDGQICNSKDLVLSPVEDFTCSAVLRDRGIKVLGAGFGDLVPTNELIKKRIFDRWRARWQQETERTLADHELQAARIRNRERAKAQQDMIYSLSQILQSDQYTSEALVMRLYQALETAATQPTTQRLLPRDTVRMLWNLRQWLLPVEHKDDHLINGMVESNQDDLEE